MIFFDESNKLDDTKKYSYYGAYGGSEEEIRKNVQSVKKILKLNNKTSEFHFTRYKNDRSIAPYFQLLHHIINSKVRLNLFIVDNDQALKMAEKRNISTSELRSLFYIKIPERLFYGLTREKSFDYDEVRILVDHSDEYGKFRLYSQLHRQMNAHSLYRGKSYQVTSVKPKQSDESIPLQIIDMFMGMVVFLIEKSYKCIDDDKPVVKSDLIYRFLMQGDNINKFQDQIRIFRWDGKKEEVRRVQLSSYLSEFMVFKSQYDIREMNKLNLLTLANPDWKTKQLREAMDYSNNQLRMLFGYKDEISGQGRNNHMMSRYNYLFPQITPVPEEAL